MRFNLENILKNLELLYTYVKLFSMYFCIIIVFSSDNDITMRVLEFTDM